MCYGSCIACDATLDQVNITFSVNMGDVETSADGVYMAGGNFGGSPPGQLMDDADGDDVWTITLPATPGSEITYKFANGPINDDWSGGFETVPSACGVGQYLDRHCTFHLQMHQFQQSVLVVVLIVVRHNQSMSH